MCLHCKDSTCRARVMQIVSMKTMIQPCKYWKKNFSAVRSHWLSAFLHLPGIIVGTIFALIVCNASCKFFDGLKEVCCGVFYLNFHLKFWLSCSQFQKRHELMQQFLFVKELMVIAELFTIVYSYYNYGYQPIEVGVIFALVWSLYIDCCIHALYEKIKNHPSDNEQLMNDENQINQMDGDMVMIT